MPVSLVIALRYLRSRRNRGFLSFITSIAILGVALGVAALIITLSILDGFEKTITDNLVGFTAHMQVFAFSGQSLKNYDEAIRRIETKFANVKNIAPYVAREAMARSEQGIEGVLVKGVDPGRDISPAKNNIVGGRYDLSEKTEGLQGVIVGKRLAEKLDISLGQKIILFALPSTSSLSLSQTRVMQFEVRGFYETGMAEFDESYVYVNLLSAQSLFQMGKGITGFDVLVKDLTKLPELTKQIPDEMGYPYFARSMEQLHRNLFTWVNLQKELVPIIIVLIVIVATANIIGTLLMMVMEKTKEIGILRSLGAERSRLVQVFMLQGAFIGVTGIILGNILAFGLCWLEIHYRFISLPADIYYMSHAPVELRLINFVAVSATAFALCLISSIIPSRIAANMDPIRVLRFAT